MGLDLVEFVITVEETFRLSIPDRDAEPLSTPRRLIEYLAGRLPSAPDGVCLSQRAFYKLRRALCRRGIASRQALTPKTDLLKALPARDQDKIWASVKAELGVVKCWPRLGRPGRFVDPDSPLLNELGEVARFVATRNPWVIREEGEGWTRKQVSEVVHGLIWEEFRLRKGEYTEDSSWTKDMGLS